MPDLEQTNIDGVTVLRLRGALDRGRIVDVEQSFRDATHRENAAVVLDLTNVDFLTTPAISMFLDAARSMKSTGGRMVVSGSQPRVEEVLRRLRLDRLLPVVRSLPEGVARVKNGH